MAQLLFHRNLFPGIGAPCGALRLQKCLASTKGLELLCEDSVKRLQTRAVLHTARNTRRMRRRRWRFSLIEQLVSEFNGGALTRRRPVLLGVIRGWRLREICALKARRKPGEPAANPTSEPCALHPRALSPCSRRLFEPAQCNESAHKRELDRWRSFAVSSKSGFARNSSSMRR